MQSSGQPLVSVIIPCFNAERYIREAIQSALDQTYPNTEVIVIDDGSTDRSVEFVRAFGARIRRKEGPNRGAAAARNRGVELARGELIQFSDADDLLDAHKLERQMEFVLQSSGDVVFSDGATIGPTNDGNTRRYVYPDPAGDIVSFLVRTNLATPSPLHWKKHLVAVGGFRTDLLCAQEYDLHLRLACRGFLFRHVPEQLFCVRHVRESVSSDYSRVLLQYPVILGPIYDSLKARGGLTDDRKRAFAETMARAARHCIQIGRAADGIRFFEQARQMHPEGGLAVYRWPARLLRRAIGPVLTERLVMLKRKSPSAAKGLSGNS